MQSRGVIGLMLFMGSAACAPDEDSVKADFDRVVARANACKEDSECVTFSPGCPLGCLVAINREHETVVRREANALIEDYERWGRACEYECVSGLGSPTCTGDKCEVGKAPEDPAQE